MVRLKAKSSVLLLSLNGPICEFFDDFRDFVGSLSNLKVLMSRFLELLLLPYFD